MAPVYRALEKSLDCYDVLCLGAFLALGHSELNALAFQKSFEAVARNRAEMGENIRARLLLDEAKTFCFVKPFNSASSCRHNNFLIFHEFDDLD